MKRLITLLVLLGLSFSSCDSPLRDVDTSDPPASQADNVLSQIPPDASPAQVDSIRTEIVQQFREQNGEDWKISWNDKAGTPLSVFAGTTKPVPGSPEQAARRFLAQHRSLFGMQKDLSDLELIEVDVSPRGLRHVRFQQTYQGIPVYKGDYQVHIRPDGRVDMANGHYYPDIEVSTSAGVSKRDARQTALADLGGQVELTKEPETTLMIYRNPEDETFVLAWRVIISEKGVHWQYFVDAKSGQILDKLELVTAITGDGDIIEETSCTTPNPVNRNLYRLLGSGYLEGIYANVHNEEAPRAFSSVNSFQYGTGSTHFDEVNLYYHIDTFRKNYLDDIGFAGQNIGSDQDLEAWAHDQQDPDAARYIFANEEVRFGDLIDFAKQDEVIYHEFTHAAADAMNGSHRLDPNATEEGAIGEGTADYFAGSYTGDAQTGVCVLFVPRDMENPDIASYDEYQNDSQYPNVEPHRGGEFFSAIMWDLRNAGGISHHHADKIIFWAITRLSGGPNFIGYRNAMMAEDDFIHDGSHQELIQNTFAARGVGSFTPLDVDINGPAQIDPGENATWTANVSNGNSPYNYTWYRKPNGPGSWSQVGTGSSYSGSAAGADDFQLRLTVSDSDSRSGLDIQTVIVGDVDPPDVCPPCIQCPCDME